MMKNIIIYINKAPVVIFSLLLFISCDNKKDSTESAKRNLSFLSEPIIDNNGFWGTKIAIWRSTTINDVFDKFEGDYTIDNSVGFNPDDAGKEKLDAFKNFDMVANGERGIGKHYGPPWYDGLVYETIRAAGDFLRKNPDKNLENRVNGYITRIAAAQNSDPDGYINTYTQLIEPDHRWGRDGGFLRWQHDVYNAGMLVEAGVHYYQGTGNTDLLEVAVKMANHMYEVMGPEPKINIIPAHAGPEEAFVDLYRLFKDDLELTKKLSVAVNPQNYYDLVEFWIDARGDHVGYPKWNQWGNQKSDQWIRDNKYENSEEFGDHARPTFGDYAQDSIPIFDQKTIEGHAVRATLLATGVTAMAIENQEDRYITTASDLWNNMVGKRMSINGGVGTIAFDEKFGPDYYLPNDAYLETCAAVGAGFFSEKMHELQKNGKYMDAFERVLYNNILSGVSLKGDTYTYENPLVGDHHHRWNWHTCPCCPPMFLKMVSALPEFIYSLDGEKLYVDLFINSSATLKTDLGNEFSIHQKTEYPWKGKITFDIETKNSTNNQFKVLIRIPEWARGFENFDDLYYSDFDSTFTISLNGKKLNPDLKDGYAVIDHDWKNGDQVSLDLPMRPRWVKANDKVKELHNMAVLASGPMIFGFQKSSNDFLDDITIDTKDPIKMVFEKNTLNGVNVITGTSLVNNGVEKEFQAIPYYTIGNENPESAYKVWVPISEN